MKNAKGFPVGAVLFLVTLVYWATQVIGPGKVLSSNFDQQVGNTAGKTAFSKSMSFSRKIVIGWATPNSAGGYYFIEYSTNQYATLQLFANATQIGSDIGPGQNGSRAVATPENGAVYYMRIKSDSPSNEAIACAGLSLEAAADWSLY